MRELDYAEESTVEQSGQQYALGGIKVLPRYQQGWLWLGGHPHPWKEKRQLEIIIYKIQLYLKSINIVKPKLL